MESFLHVFIKDCVTIILFTFLVVEAFANDEIEVGISYQLKQLVGME